MYKEKNLKKAEVINLLKNYVKLLKKSDINCEKVFLYGSFAKDKASKWSDIDVVVISDDFSNRNLNKEDELWNIRENIDLRISPLGYSKEDWDNEISIKGEVEKYGIEIN